MDKSLSRTSAIVTRLTRGEPAVTRDDELAREEPLELRVEGRPVAVTMRTPGHEEELALGFLFTEGVVSGLADVLDLDICSAGEDSAGNVVNVRLRHPESVDLDRLSRHVFTSSSCGICGKATIDDALDAQGTTALPALASVRCGATTLLALPAKLHAAQATFQATGGLHAAALFDAQGNLIVVREDVGRHNAVDKVLGRLLLDRPQDAGDFGLLVSGRIAFEIVQKARRAGLALVAGISAPTSLAVDYAHAAGMTLVGFLRDDHCNVYTGRLAEE